MPEEASGKNSVNRFLTQAWGGAVSLFQWRRFSWVDGLVILGLVGIGRNRFTDAENYLSRAAALMETALPPDHPDFALVWTNLGALYTAQARYGPAESMLQKALAHQIRVLGMDTAASYWTLKEYANLLRLTKRQAEAGRMEARAREVVSRNAQLSFLPYVVDTDQLKKK